MENAQDRNSPRMPRSVLARTLRRVAIMLVAYLAVSNLVVWSSARDWDRSQAEGHEVWRRENCMACHAVFGLGGHMGADLTNVISRRGGPYVEAVVRNGLNKMPAFDLSSQEMEALIEYLARIDALGEYPLKGVRPPAFGRQKEGGLGQQPSPAASNELDREETN